MKKLSSETDLQRIDAMCDADIDTSDIPPLGEDFFRRAAIRKREPKISITLRVDKHVLEWFKSTGRGYQSRMNAVLKTYASKQTDRVSHNHSLFECLKQEGLIPQAHIIRDGIIQRRSVWPALSS